MLSVELSHCAECRYAKWHYTESRGALMTTYLGLVGILENVVDSCNNEV